MSERRLYIGAPLNCAGWEVYDSSPNRDVDRSGPLDRSGLPDGAYTIVYAACMDRLDLRTSALRALHDWHRILAPGGLLLTACVDAQLAARELAQASGLEEQASLARWLGGTAWTQNLLSTYLQLAGFRQIRRAERHGLFRDVSELSHGKQSLALNLISTRP